MIRHRLMTSLYNIAYAESNVNIQKAKTIINSEYQKYSVRSSMIIIAVTIPQRKERRAVTAISFMENVIAFLSSGTDSRFFLIRLMLMRFSLFWNIS